MLRIVVVADIRAYRDVLVDAFNGTGQIRARGLPYNLEPLKLVIETWLPDVIVVDVSVDRGIEVTSYLRRKFPEISIISYGVSSKSDDILACAIAGASGFVLADASLDDLVGVIAEVRSGRLRCPPSVTFDLFHLVGGFLPGSQRPESDLTPRERQVLSLLGQGQSNKEIARDLGIAVSTVKNHVHHILEKSNSSSRRQAVQLAVTGRMTGNSHGPSPRTH